MNKFREIIQLKCSLHSVNFLAENTHYVIQLTIIIPAHKDNARVSEVWHTDNWSALHVILFV